MKNKNILFLIVGLVLIFSIIASAQDEDIYTGCENEKFFLISVKANENNFLLENKYLINGCSPRTKDVSSFEYSYKLQNNENILYENGLNSQEFFIDTYNLETLSGGVVPITSENIYLIAPYTEDANKILIYQGETKVFETSVGELGASSCRIK